MEPIRRASATSLALDGVGSTFSQTLCSPLLLAVRTEMELLESYCSRSSLRLLTSYDSIIDKSNKLVEIDLLSLVIQEKSSNRGKYTYLPEEYLIVERLWHRL